MKRIEISIGRGLKATLKEFAEIAQRVERKERLPPSIPQLRFSSISQLFSAITEKRLEMIRYVAAHRGLNTRQLAQALGRDYKNVHTDVRDLCDYGLLRKDSHAKLSAPYDEIVIRADVRRTRKAA
ncbi:MAG: HVO_A0114 family putative DNA-binding protein [Acidiferrobacterales bacterium]